MLDCALVSHLNGTFQLPIIMTKKAWCCRGFATTYFLASLLGDPTVWVSRTVPIGVARSFASFEHSLTNCTVLYALPHRGLLDFAVFKTYIRLRSI